MQVTSAQRKVYPGELKSSWFSEALPLTADTLTTIWNGEEGSEAD